MTAIPDKYLDLLERKKAFAALATGTDRSTRTQRYAADIAVDYNFSRNVRHE